MKAAIGIVGEGRVALALTGREGVVAGPSLLDVAQGTKVILIEGDSGPGLESIRAALGPGPALFRIVAGPAVGLGVGPLVLCPEPGTPVDVVDAVTRLLTEIGVVEVVPEDTLPAAGAVVGSAAGLVAVALEGVEEGAVEAGLARDSARALVRQTLLATALLVQDHPGSPADLKDQVASPGGTTIAGLGALEDRSVRGAYIRAIEEEAKLRSETGRRG